MAHLYASFADASLAEKAAGALLDYGVRQEDISLVANDQYGEARTLDATATAAPYGGTATGAAASGAFGAEGASAGYASPGMSMGLGGAPGLGVVGLAGDMNPLDRGGPDTATDFSLASEGDVEAQAKHGISTTTPEDAGEGAVKGTGIGLGVGILASLAALTIPGVGLVLGGGALAAALGATALTAGAGALAGGATGFLKEQGVPAEAAERYHGTISGGGAVLSLGIPSGKVDQAAAEAVLSKYGASDVRAY